MIVHVCTLCTQKYSIVFTLHGPICVCVIGACGDVQVVPYQNQVIQALGPCLDDRKRLVRKEAVKSRSNWYIHFTVLCNVTNSLWFILLSTGLYWIHCSWLTTQSTKGTIMIATTLCKKCSLVLWGIKEWCDLFSFLSQPSQHLL